MRRIKKHTVKLSCLVCLYCVAKYCCIGLIRGCYSHLRDQTIAYARKTTVCDIVLEPATKHNIGCTFLKMNVSVVPLNLKIVYS